MEYLITQILTQKKGDREFMLHLVDGNKFTWVAAIGNPGGVVPIGEALAYGDNCVDCVGHGPTPTDALIALLARVRTWQG